MRAKHFWMCGREINVWKNTNKKLILTTKMHSFIHSTKSYRGFCMRHKVNKTENVSTIRDLTFLSVEMDKTQENKLINIILGSDKCSDENRSNDSMT